MLIYGKNYVYMRKLIPDYVRAIHPTVSVLGDTEEHI